MSFKKGIWRETLSVDSLADRDLLDDKPACLLIFCTDVMNVGTMKGFERAIILLPCSPAADTYRRVGLVEYMSTMEWIEEMQGPDYPETDITIV